MLFWILVTLLTLIIIIVGFYPLLTKSPPKSGLERNELNKALYFDRLTELKSEDDKGLIDNREQFTTELQQSLLQDIPETNEHSVAMHNNSSKRIAFFWLSIITIMISLGSYLYVGSWQEQSLLEKRSNDIQHLLTELSHTEKPSQQLITQTLVALRTKLQQQPQDARTWWLLGSIAGNEAKDRSLALESFAKAYALEPNNPEYGLSLAKYLLFTQEQRQNEQGREILRKVISIDHSNMDALALIAFDAYQRQDYTKAISSWQMMLQLLPKADTRREVLEKSIANAQSLQKTMEK